MVKKKKKYLSTSSKKVVVVGLGVLLLFSFVYAKLKVEKNSINVLSEQGGIPAFPGAQGFGSRTPGGRGGKIIEVTNLNDSGAGSFRQAVEVETVPRIVVFKVGGKISAKDEIKIVNPYITIAGQTAPGDGIAIEGARLAIETHDVIVRGLRMRVGDGPGQATDNRDGIGVSGFNNREVYNIVIDHNSISWAIDESFTTWDNSSTKDKVHDVTFSNNIISESLNCSNHIDEDTGGKDCRSMGILVGDYTKNVSVHHNLLASNNARNPLICSGTASEFVNNVVYNWGLLGTDIANCNNVDKPIRVDVVGNYYKPTDGSVVRQGDKKGIYVRCLPGGSKVHVSGNVGPGRLKNSGDDWLAVVFGTECSSSESQASGTALTTLSGLMATSAEEAYTQVLASAGARYPSLDPVDSRAISNTKQGTSPVVKQIINNQTKRDSWLLDSPEEAGSKPVYRTISSNVLDIDRDGMPDEWEKGRGGDLNPSTPTTTGYTWIEEYINSLITGESRVTISSSTKLSPNPTSTAVVSTPPVASTKPATTTTSNTQTVKAFMDAFVDYGYPTKTDNSNILKSRIGTKQQIAYIKFVPTSITSVKKAVLRIKVTNPSINDHYVYAVADDWSEDNITYNTRKKLQNKLATFRASSTGWVEIDLTQYIASKVGQTRLSVAITTDKYDDLWFMSSESNSPPELVVTY